MSMSITVGDDRDDDARDDDTVDLDDERDHDDADDRVVRRDRRDDQEAGPSDDDQDDDEEPEGGWKAEAARLRRALAKSNATGLRRRNQLRELRNAESKADDDEDDSDDEGEEKPEQKKSTGLDARQVQRSISKAVQRREKELQEAHRRDLIDTKADSALTRAGVSEKNIRLLKRELDYEELELLKDRSVDGLEEEIDRLRTEFPDLFKSGRTGKRRINGGDDRDSARGKKGPMTASQRQAAQLRGSGS